ncbi:asparaginase [Hazenella sp. IB182357]|uniref:asparaginase n=1 Tax=Polycladospora coralii TaxID=2771432 RepID=A0A926N7T1_9BACL|nr:asparaginase [Polycladospora coralii]MBD1371646.1 asparaginase [Polycladospora coralii]MBS7529113.1 asparaginase [Polycladospora coralii]
MKKIIVLTTGGTIAMQENEHTQGVKPENPNVLNNVIPLLSKYASVEMEHIFNLPSPHITFAHMYQVALKVQAYLDQSDIGGVVISHGTDVLEETAFFLDLVIQSEKPVIVTGAMRSQNELGADGPYNLVNAVRVAAHASTSNYGTLVVFNDEIHAARTVTKTHTSNIATFQSPTLGPIGFITKKEVTFSRQVTRPKPLPLKPCSDQIALLKAAAGMDSQLLNFVINSNYEGIVIEALGQGNLPPTMLPGIEAALKKKIPIILVSRCYNGFVQDTYDYEGGGKQLMDRGVIFSNGLNGQKARVKLALTLNITKEPSQLQQFFSI